MSRPGYTYEDDTYLCIHESSGSKQSLCDGDEGGPLLCVPPKKDNEKGSGGSGELYLLGVTILVKDELNCTDPENNFMFSYMPKYRFWINLIISKTKKRDASQNQTSSDLKNFYNSTKITTPSDNSLPSYYDTEDYDRMRKSWFRCHKGGQIHPNIFRDSFTFLKKQSKPNFRYTFSASTPLGCLKSTILIGVLFLKLIIYILIYI